MNHKYTGYKTTVNMSYTDVGRRIKPMPATNGKEFTSPEILS